VLNRLNEIEAQMARNQAQTMRAIDSLQRSIDGEALAKAVKDLSPLEAHIFEAAKAWEALSDCADAAVKAGATCRVAGEKMLLSARLASDCALLDCCLNSLAAGRRAPYRKSKSR